MWYIIWGLFMAYGIYLFVLVWMRQSAAKWLALKSSERIYVMDN